MKFVGNVNLLAQKGYEIDSSYNYYFKTIVNRKNNRKLTCFINIFDKNVSFVGDENNKVFFLNELNGNLSEK